MVNKSTTESVSIGRNTLISDSKLFLRELRPIGRAVLLSAQQIESRVLSLTDQQLRDEAFLRDAVEHFHHMLLEGRIKEGKFLFLIGVLGVFSLSPDADDVLLCNKMFDRAISLIKVRGVKHFPENSLVVLSLQQALEGSCFFEDSTIEDYEFKYEARVLVRAFLSLDLTGIGDHAYTAHKLVVSNFPILGVNWLVQKLTEEFIELCEASETTIHAEFGDLIHTVMLSLKFLGNVNLEKVGYALTFPFLTIDMHPFNFIEKFGFNETTVLHFLNCGSIYYREEYGSLSNINEVISNSEKKMQEKFASLSNEKRSLATFIKAVRKTDHNYI